MTTLGTMMDRIQDEMGRGSDAEVRREILSAISELEREAHHFAERRLAIVELAANQIWYSEVGFRDASAFTADQITAIQNIPSNDLEYTFDDLPWTGRVSDIIRVQYVRLWEDGDGSQTWEMRPLDYETFERLYEGASTAAQPHAYTMNGNQIGVFPKPDKFYPLLISGFMKPFTPAGDGTQDGSTSTWFSQAEELVRMAAKTRLAGNYRDMEGFQMFGAQARQALNRLRSENALRSTLRVKPHGPC